MYIVHIKTDEYNRVTAVDTGEFILDKTDWIPVDIDGYIEHHHRRGRYVLGEYLTDRGASIYKYVDEKIIHRTAEEIAADIALIPPPPPTIDEKLALMRPLLTEMVKDKSSDIVISASAFILDWAQGKYTLGDVRMWQGQPKRCCQSHDSTNNPDWLPNVASLWAPFHATKEENALPYVPPTGAHDIYKVGEYMAFTGGKYYLNVEDTNFSPTEYPAAWHVKSDSGAYVAIAMDEPETEEPDPAIEYNSNGTIVWAEWLTWDGLNNHLYQVGDRVTYNGTRYTSTTGNSHWQPGVYGWSVA